MRLILFEPDIPQNVGAVIRLAACLGVPLDVIEPCGFVFDDRRLKRAGMDYLDKADLTRYNSWRAYAEGRARDASSRLLLLTTSGEMRYTDFRFAPGDRLLMGRESAGVPAEVHRAADARLVIPTAPGCRSLNIATAAAMALGEALRQTAGFPGTAS